MNTVISRHPTTVTYTKWINTKSGFVRDGSGIIINGGAGIVGGYELLSNKSPDERSREIPIGVHTYVPDEVLEKLMTIPTFVRDLDKGLVAVVRGSKIDRDKANDIAASDMAPSSQISSAPITREEIEATGAEINSDGSIDISKVNEGVSPLKVRKEDAGQTIQTKKRNASKRKGK